LRARILIALAGGVALVAPSATAAPAGAATEIGQLAPGSSDDCGLTVNTVQATIAGPPSYEVPGPGGVITSWSIKEDVTASMARLQLWRPAGGTTFTLVGRSELESTTAGNVSTFTTQIPAEEGALLGLRVATGELSCAFFTGSTGDVVRYDNTGASDAALGEMRNLLNATALRLNVSAIVEPDCDGDGFGDETQDSDLSACRARTLSLDANKNKVKKGKKVSLSGHLESAEHVCESAQPVDLQRKRPKQTTFTTFAQLQTDAAGNFTAKKKVKKTFQYRAQVPETATCGGQVSNTEKVKVKKKR
jgi:hypothetical protein